MVDFNDDNAILDHFMSHAIKNKPFRIPVDAWKESGLISYPFETTVPVEEMAAHNEAFLIFDWRSVLLAREAGIPDGIGESVDGGVKIYAAALPRATLSGHCSSVNREVP
jgi:hypothetical protein